MVEPMRIPVLMGDLGTFEFEAKEGQIFVNGERLPRDVAQSLKEAAHLVVVRSDLQRAAMRKGAA